jgi:Uma2 family endonuclease
MTKEGYTMPLPQTNNRYTYADYCTWDDDERWELINGEVYAMSPAPTTKHQGISVNLSGQLFNFLIGKPCRLFVAPFDVRLNAEDEDDTVVQPDLVVICDLSKIDDKGCKGAPDLVVEILSPSTAKKDRITKLNVYQSVGVREYWIIDPETQTVQVCVFENGMMKGYDDTETVPVTVLPGCAIDLQAVFAV